MIVERYELSLSLDMDGEKYTGKETIHFKGNEKKLCINSDWHKITKSLLNGNSINLTKGDRNDEYWIEGNFSENSQLYFEFNGPIKRSLTGMYLATDRKGNKVVSTQFEAIGARKAFPCFDSPLFKAEFDFSIEVPSEYEAISNTPVSSLSEKNGKSIFTFHRTPRMSTYLMYIGVGKYDHKDLSSGKTSIILTAPRGELLTTDTPLKMAASFLKYYEDYFDIPFVLPKVHLIAVPEFSAGAMENWGAITFRQTALLINENSGTPSLRRVAEVIAHELAHQWFGNLVTMKWWDDIWLNESFATFMAYKAVDSIYPKWNIQGMMLLTDGNGAFKDDALVHTSPIESHVKHPDEMAGLSSHIRYGKGGMILRMIESYVGEEQFKLSLRKFLNMYKYSNAEGSELWNIIAKETGIPVDKIMSEWIRKEGYPYIQIVEKGNKLQLTQSRFLLNGEKDSELWQIPVSVERKNGIDIFLQKFKETLIDGNGFIKTNHNLSGFYRTFYSLNSYRNIEEHYGKMSFQDQVNIISDLSAFTLSGKIPLSEYISISGKLMKNMSVQAKIQFSNDLEELFTIRHGDHELNRLYSTFHRVEYENLVLKKNLDDDDRILLSTVLPRLVIVDSKRRSELGRLFSSGKSIDPDYREAVFISYATDSQDLNGLWKRYNDSTSDEDKTKLLKAMGRLYGSTNFNQVMDWIRSEKIKKQDMITYLFSFSTSQKNWDLALQEFERIIKTIETLSNGFQRRFQYITRTIPISGLADTDRALGILSSIKDEELRRAVGIAREKLDINRKFKTR